MSVTIPYIPSVQATELLSRLSRWSESCCLGWAAQSQHPAPALESLWCDDQGLVFRAKGPGRKSWPLPFVICGPGSVTQCLCLSVFICEMGSIINLPSVERQQTFSPLSVHGIYKELKSDLGTRKH